MRWHKAISTMFITCMTPMAAAGAEEHGWQYGLGTGILALNIEGDTGFATPLGPLIVSNDMDWEDLSNILETLVGVNGFARKGAWTVTYGFQSMKVGGTNSGTIPMVATPASVAATLEVTFAEVAVAYTFAQSGMNFWGVRGGLRYIEHEYDANVTVGMANFTENVDQDWTDFVVGLTHARPLSKRVAWTSRADIGFGGSEGTWTVNSGINWQLHEHFAIALFGQYSGVDFENGSPGDPDWYLYDNDEFGLGCGFMYTWVAR